MAVGKPGLAIVIGVPKDGGPGGPPPMKSPGDSVDPLQAGSKDRSTQFCENCSSYCTDGYCMLYPEWQQHEAKDWCAQWTAGEPRDLKGDAAGAGAGDPDQSQPAQDPNQPQPGGGNVPR